MALSWSWFRKDQNETETKTKTQVTRPVARKTMEDMVCNVDLTRGLYHNSYQGIKLGGFACGPAIDVPVSFMGTPIVTVESEPIQELIDQIMEQMVTEFDLVHTEANRDGTDWIWPWFDSATMTLEWEHISDDRVTKILKDPITMKVTEIWVEEDLELSTETDSTRTVKKTRKFRYDKITTILDGQSKVTRNVAGVLPVAFANNRDSGHIRGYSDYERILPDIKAYAEIYQQMLEDLAQFRPKWIQSASNVDTWVQTNGYSNVADVDVTNCDFILNVKDQEDTKFEIPDKVASGYIEALKTCFRKIVEGSGIPEIAWGLKTEGNMASVEENMEALMRYVSRKQMQYTKAWETLLTASLRLLGIAMMQNTGEVVKVTWDSLDAASAKTKSEVLRNTAESVSKLVSVAAITKQQMYSIMLEVVPDATEESLEEYVAGIRDMAGHSAFTKATYEEQLAMAGIDTEADG